MLLSICLPTYNRREQAERQLNFLLEDAEPFLGVDVEILVSNNASPDGTDEVIKDIRAKNDKFQYFLQEENIGGMPNLFFLAKKACGKYIWFTGDDDILRPGTVGRVVEILKKYDETDLGVVLLGVLDSREDSVKENYIDGSVNWEKIGSMKTSSEYHGLKTYECNKMQSYTISGVYGGGFLFISASIVLKEIYLKVINDFEYERLYTLPWASAYLAIRGRSFFADSYISIYANICEFMWKDSFIEILGPDSLKCILNLGRLGVCDSEIRPMVNYFLTMPGAWRYLFHPRVGFEMNHVSEFVSLVVKNGYFLPFAIGLFKAAAGYFKHSFKRLFKKVGYIV